MHTAVAGQTRMLCPLNLQRWPSLHYTTGMMDRIQGAMMHLSSGLLHVGLHWPIATVSLFTEIQHEDDDAFYLYLQDRQRV